MIYIIHVSGHVLVISHSQQLAKCNWQLKPPRILKPSLLIKKNITNIYLDRVAGMYACKNLLTHKSGLANFIDEWSQCDFCFTNFGVILEYLESSIRLSSTWSRHVYTIVRDTRSSCGGPLTWKAQIHGGGHRVNFDRNLPSSCFVVEYNSLISMI